MSLIDINFKFYSDTPKGKDPDAYSETLKEYHKFLWSKGLPNGKEFDLHDNHSVPLRLYHKSELGKFILSSDSLGHTYRKWKRMSHIINKIQKSEMNDFFSICSTIGGYIIFPANQIEKKDTMNQSRGKSAEICDRWDLTLECIRCFYINELNPLTNTLQRYSSFFSLFKNFKGYVDFFLLNDLVDDNYLSIKFYLPFNSFNKEYNPLPNTLDEYLLYKNNVVNFIKSRNKRILQYEEKKSG
ncbi:MAG: hypothetical protein VYD59_04665 [Bacteroidota bacterium]|nr:hypothetical protein [Bacteroidota bacterium]